MDRMEVKRDIYKLWLHYKAKNEEDYFHQFVRGFVSIWEEQLQLDWSSLPNWSDIRPDAGPHLSRLPEELLATVTQFMQQAKQDTERKTLNCGTLSEIELIINLLTILARNLDNIPLVASCDYVSISIGMAATVIHQLVEESAHFGEAGVSFFLTVCHLLEVLYDPYFTWRHFLRGNEANFEKIAFQPALLHVEVIPFIYDCFETSLIESYPHLGSELLHVLGAVVSGAQHNALRAICPATVNMIIAIVANSVTPTELRYHALQCFVLMARVLLKSAPDQRQIEVGTMVQQLREVLLRGLKEENWTPDSVHAFTQMVSAMRALMARPASLKRTQAHNISYTHAQALHAHMQQLLIDCQVPDALLHLLKESAGKKVEKQSMAVEVVRVVSALLAGSSTVKERLLKADVYTRLAEALRSLGDPKRPLLRALLALASEEEGLSSTESGSPLKNGHALLILLRWLPAVPDVDQVWLAENIAKLCNASLQSRVVCSAHKVILEICSLLEQHASLSRAAVGELLGLLEGLAAHCITPLELKSIFLLLREGDPDEKCPYQSQLLHAISAVARRGEHSDCHYFFDIQNDTDGLSVPGIRKWPGAGYGFSFHCWVKLDSENENDAPSPPSPTSRSASPSPSPSPVASPASVASGRSLLSPMMAPMMAPSPSGSNPTSPASSQASNRTDGSNKRRQLFNLLTSNNTGVEVFFRADGMLVVAISTKKEFLTATVPDIPLADNRWHCIGVCITMARRPFGHNQIQVFVDGTQRLAASIKFPSMSEPFTYCTIGSVVQRGAATRGGLSGDGGSRSGRFQAQGMLERAAGAGGGLLPSFMNQVPSYLSLPLPLRNSAPLDPNVKSFQAGLQDAVWGAPGCLRGQLSTAALLQDALSPPHARMLYQQGPNWRGLFSSEEGADLSELVARLVFCFSPAACWDNLCLDLAPGNKYDGHVVATQCSTLGIKTAVNGIGGIHVVFPILEQAARGKVDEEAPVIPSSHQRLSVTASGTGTIVHPSEDLDDWEVLPSSSYADWKLELNPVSGFLSYLRNLLFGSPLNQEQLLRNHGAAILGHLLSEVKPSLLDVNVLMVAQLLLEMARDAGNPALLRALHQHVLFNFNIWSRGPFHIRIGHIQYISSVIKEDRKSFRKRYGVQFLLDTIRTHHSAPGDLVGADDGRALRLAILRLIRYYISKEVNIKEVTAIIGFLTSVKEEILVLEVLEMLILHLEGQCKDQLYLLLFEPHAADLLYCLLIDRRFSMDLKQKVLKLTSVLLRTDRVYEPHKKRLRLQDSVLGLVGVGIGMYPGLIALLGDQELSMEVAAMLLDQMLLTETPASYAAALSLLHSLSLASLEIKVEAARKILTTLFMRPNAPAALAKQVGWQDCVSRLLVKRPISTAPTSVEDSSLPDLMTFDEDVFEMDMDKVSLIHRSHSPSSVSRISASVSDAASMLESEIKDVAESVTIAIGDNIQYAADNISSVMASAYSVFRQKTVDIQESLEGLGESAVHRLKNGSGVHGHGRSASSVSSLGERPSISASADSSSPLASASASPGNRSRCSSSSEDVSSAAAESSRASLSVTDGAAQSAQAGQADADSDTEEQREALRQWVALDADRQGDREEDLCYLVLNILFTTLWRGVETGSRDCWRERGQVMACINLLGLNNELHGSHLQLKLRLLEMGVQAALSDLRESASAATSSGAPAAPATPHASAADNAAQLLRWVYDLVVLDPNPDCSKKVSTKLLDGVLGLLDALLVFHDGPQEEWTEMAKLSFGILLSCAAGPQLDLCAMSTAKLHALVQTRRHATLEESAYLLYSLDGVVQEALKGENQEHYSFLIPAVKALVQKLSAPLCVPQYCLDIPSTAGHVFFDEFQSYSRGEQWRQFVDTKVKPLYDAYKATLSSQVTEAMNTFWAECYEASKASALKRHREVAASKIRFQEQIGVPFRARAAEDNARHSNMLSQQRNRQVVVRRQWRTSSSFLSGPRGSWRHRTPEERHWKLSHHENFSRMRLKLCPSLAFNRHTDASNLRDNTGWLSRRRSSETPLSLSSWSAAVRPELDDDALPEEDLRSLLSEPEPAEEVTREEKSVLSQECELVTLMTSVRGRLELTTTHASFHDLSPLQEDGERQDFKWPLSRLREVHLRRYNLRRSALEFFLMDQTNYFLNFTPKTRNKVYSRILGLRPPNLILSSSRSPAEMLRASGLTQKWVNREISNFDYLMQLNTIAGRSYNDLSQYPVFPWIIADYTSKELDLDNPATFRDLSKPVGVVNPKNVAEVKAKYDNFEDPSGVIAKFHYGTHYSNSAGVLHYLVRVEPFTSLHIELQSGRFDVADRQFHSIPQTWKLLMDNPNDVKELTPEFFYFPEFLKNLNGFDLGLLQGTKERVNDVILPPWASSPEDFIFKHRRALECEYVSAHLHEWIDLIFGYKQKGPKAVEALNVFYYCSYEGAVDLDALKSAVEREAMEGMINNFGQTPCQLLREPHPQRLPLSESGPRQLRPDLTQHLDKIRPFTIMELTTDRDPVAFLSQPRSQPRNFLAPALPDLVVTVTRSGVVGVHSWLPVDRHSPRGFTFEVDPSVGNAKTRKKLPAPPHPAVPASSHLFCVSHDGKVLMSGGHWDCSLRGWSIARAKPLFSVVRHFDLVTCVALDRCGWFLVTGSRDTTCVVWDLAGGGAADGGLGSGIGALTAVTGGTTASSGGGASNPAAPKPVQTLYGHDSAVTCVAIMTELDMVVSGSTDGTVNVHTIREGQYLRTLHPVGCVDPQADVAFLTLSHLGHIAFTANDQASNSVHVYSVNGVHLGSKYVSGRVTGLVTVGENVVVVDDAGDLTISRLYGLRPIYDVPLHVPVQTIMVTPSNTHLLLPLRDGNLVVVGVPPHGSS